MAEEKRDPGARTVARVLDKAAHGDRWMLYDREKLSVDFIKSILRNPTMVCPLAESDQQAIVDAGVGLADKLAAKLKPEEEKRIEG
jgi:hypothetical protein